MASPIVAVLVVDFHHARGPEIEWCCPEESEPRPLSWDLLPFQALPDGAHLREEDYAYFTTRNDAGSSTFGIACVRQIKAAELKVLSPEVTRSTIQKAVVVLTTTPHVFPHVKEKLGAVTRAYFGQRDFGDREILLGFHESLVAKVQLQQEELYTGMPVRQLVHDFRSKVLILVKALLLERRVLYFGTSNIEALCSTQYAVLSLIPGLLEALDYCADPTFGKSEQKSRRRLSNLKTSDRRSLLKYLGMPLQPFDRGSFFGPYTPLQQVDLLEDVATTSYMIGSSNTLFLHNKEKHCDVLVNVDDHTIEILLPVVKPQLALTPADRRWVESYVRQVDETWDPQFPDCPSTRTFAASEEDVRGAFERYIFGLASVVKRDEYSGEPLEESSSVTEYGGTFVDAWKLTRNYLLWKQDCDDECFDIVEPRHPGHLDGPPPALALADVQLRLSAAMHDLKLEERTKDTRAAVYKTWQAGSEKLGKLWEADEKSDIGKSKSTADSDDPLVVGLFSGLRTRMNQTWQKAQMTVQQAAREHQEEQQKRT
ncbi:hypothetical protein PYCC9005_004389 [Savitreella phatthalungensis]